MERKTRFELATFALARQRSTTEPLPQKCMKLNGGNNRARTYDPLLVRQMLSQLSYAPMLFHTSILYQKILLKSTTFYKKINFFKKYFCWTSISFDDSNSIIVSLYDFVKQKSDIFDKKLKIYFGTKNNKK